MYLSASEAERVSETRAFMAGNPKMVEALEVMLREVRAGRMGVREVSWESGSKDGIATFKEIRLTICSTWDLGFPDEKDGK